MSEWGFTACNIYKYTYIYSGYVCMYVYAVELHLSELFWTASHSDMLKIWINEFKKKNRLR